MLPLQIVNRVGADAIVRTVLVVTIITSAAFAADLKAPKQATAGEGITITAGDSGELCSLARAAPASAKFLPARCRFPARMFARLGDYMAILDGDPARSSSWSRPSRARLTFSRVLRAFRSHVQTRSAA